MDDKRLTQWYHITVLPKRRGPYELGFKGCSGAITPMAFPFHWFNGKNWTQGYGCVAAKPSKPWGKPRPLDAPSVYGLDAYWRGLAENPNAR